MSQITLNATTQRPTGSRPVRRLRAEGQIPGVVYGEGTAPFSVAVNAKDFRTAMGRLTFSLRTTHISLAVEPRLAQGSPKHVLRFP